MADTTPTPVETGTPAAGSTAGGFDVFGLLIQNWWVVLIVIIVAIFGLNYLIKKGWEQLQMRYNMNGKPLAPLNDIMRRSFRLMFKEDESPFFKSGKKPNFTWKKYWQIMLTSTIVSLGLFFVLPISVSGIIFAIVVGFILYGVSHIKLVFSYRFRILMQMFEVAQAEMRYDRGANLNPWGFIQISGWTNLYYAETTTIMFPAKYRSEEQRNRDAFEIHFNGTVSDQHTWTYKWEPSNNRVICEPVPFIPESAPYPIPDKHPWNEFPLGLSAGGDEAVLDVSKFPHLLIAGVTGSGKSVTQRTLLLHALQSPEWRIVLIDPKRVELSSYKSHPNVARVATELEESLQLIEQIEQEMQSRYITMQENGVNFFKDLPNAPHAVLLMIDETFALLSPTGIKTDEGKAQDEMKGRIGVLIGSIARLGRAAGIHMMLATQRPDAKVLPGEVKNNLDARIAQGRMDTTPSLMVLDSDEATRIPDIRGRAVLRTGNLYTEFQAYFLPQDKLPIALEMAAAIAQGDTSWLDEDENGIPDALEHGPSLFDRIKSKMPKGLIARISEWVAKREEVIKENEIRAGRTVEAREEREARKQAKKEQAAEQGYKKTAQTVKHDEPSIAEIAEQARLKGVTGAGNPMFDDPLPTSPVIPQNIPEIVEENIPNTSPTPSNVNVSEDYYSFEDEDDEDYTDYDEDDDYEDGEEEFAPEEESVNKIVLSPKEVLSASVSVEEVMRRSAERGVPIPASELLAALKAEAAAQQIAEKNKLQNSENTNTSTFNEEPINSDMESNITPMEAPALKPVEKPYTPAVEVEAPEPISTEQVVISTIPAPPVAAEAPLLPVVEVLNVPQPPTRPSRPQRPTTNAEINIPETPTVEPAIEEPKSNIPQFDEAPWMPKVIPTRQTGQSPFGLPPKPPAAPER